MLGTRFCKGVVTMGRNLIPQVKVLPRLIEMKISILKIGH